MNKLILTVGLPKSGKTTWALKQGHPVVSRDAIRLALHGEAYLQSAENMVSTIEAYMVASLFYAGHETVIIDAAHLRKRYVDRWESSLWELELKFFSTPADICIERAVADEKPELIPIIKAMDKPEYYNG